VPRKTMFKIGLATAAAAVAAIMAITSAFAHGTPTTTGRSIVATIVNTASGAGLTSNDSVAPTTVTDEQAQDAVEAAELAAKIAAEQQQEAAELAAKQAALAAEQAAEAAEATDEDASETEVDAPDTDKAKTESSGDDHSGD
jgi:septal ring factor EnvC (AmiA/AmiB activator)